MPKTGNATRLCHHAGTNPWHMACHFPVEASSLFLNGAPYSHGTGATSPFFESQSDSDRSDLLQVETESTLNNGMSQPGIMSVTHPYGVTGDLGRKLL